MGHTGLIKALAAVSEHELLSGSDDKTIRLWNINDGSCIREFGSTKNALVFSVIHVCEGFFLSCGRNNIKVYNIRTGKCVKSYETPRVSLAVARLDMLYGESICEFVCFCMLCLCFSGIMCVLYYILLTHT